MSRPEWAVSKQPTTHGRWRLKSAPPSFVCHPDRENRFPGCWWRYKGRAGVRVEYRAGTRQPVFPNCSTPLPLKRQEAANYRRKAAPY
jgi:hypothetical protein